MIARMLVIAAVLLGFLMVEQGLAAVASRLPETTIDGPYVEEGYGLLPKPARIDALAKVLAEVARIDANLPENQSVSSFDTVADWDGNGTCTIIFVVYICTNPPVGSE